MTTLADIVAEARSWERAPTPYKHQARMKSVGVDCVGLVIGVGRARGLLDPAFDVGGYGRTPDGRTLQAGCDEQMDRIPFARLRPGNVVLMRFDEEPQHMAIVADYPHGGLSMIHAYSRSGRVVEHRLADVWRTRIVQAYAFRGVTDV